MSCRPVEVTLMVLTKDLLEATSLICLISPCFTLLQTEHLMGLIDFLSATKWTLLTIVSTQVSHIPCSRQSLIYIYAHLTCLSGCRSQATVECTLWSQQCDHFSWCSMVETLVLVVVARPPSWHQLACTTPSNYRVTPQTLYLCILLVMMFLRVKLFHRML